MAFLSGSATCRVTGLECNEKNYSTLFTAPISDSRRHRLRPDHKRIGLSCGRDFERALRGNVDNLRAGLVGLGVAGGGADSPDLCATGGARPLNAPGNLGKEI